MQKKDLVTTTLGMSQSEFGAALVTEAQNRKQKEKLERSISTAQNILSSLEGCDRQIEHLQSWKKTHEDQLEALQNGAFSFNAAGDIVYNDVQLNRR